jgi:hypothetical protein
VNRVNLVSLISLPVRRAKKPFRYFIPNGQTMDRSRFGSLSLFTG